MILIDSQFITVESILGEISELFIINNSILQQIIIKPATGSTTYDFSLEDVDGLDYYSETNCSGEYNQLVNVPVYGNIIVNITNASVDETFIIKLIFRRS
jgi:hypothetical protein